ncbi:F-box protein CPR1-like isoform X2 [Populus alba x Populus x berolinensis]|uniref:F-box domain-containing protein n=1 Tax=Populus alba TaxID=43335 RepID=A0A4U5QGD9_POPAL|nr:F-box protein CPR1-like isoform X2 [Populus alba]XP_034921252.1 F-box protein CPR1-like isoform X2 [Populus alba]XP_034921253.1 F-box protein CPR1-like isoform X2 [Populus alba]KAJ6961564.1 F-box protein CPR1-like isoform X2 [Populus alba x Populus x berolinensis]TKS09191.1 hypothetical protein D5086_0000095950 [Populus alba]
MKTLMRLFPEIAADILSRLPVKSLKRFRCVSKSWCKEIDSLYFINTHLKRSSQAHTHLSLILRDATNLCTVDLDSPDFTSIKLKNNPLKSDHCATEVMGSCNGLLALLNSDFSIALYNPSTREKKMIPVSPLEFPNDLDDSKVSSLFNFYGFGHDPINEDYKVVRFIHFYGDSPDGFFHCEVKVYSLKSNSWKRIDEYPYDLRFILPPDYHPRCRRGYGVFANSAVHWKATVVGKGKENGSDLIVAFDLGAEEFKIIPQPDYSSNEHEMNVGVLGGCLCVFCNKNCKQVEIWVMKEYGVKESWTHLCTVIAKLQVKEFWLHARPLAYSKGGDKILLELDNRFFVWYDLRRRKSKIIKIRGAPPIFIAEICVGSLVTLNGGGEGQTSGKDTQEKRKTRKKRDQFLSKGFKLVL